GREIFEELGQRLPSFEVVQQRRERHTRADEHGGTAHDFWIAVNDRLALLHAARLLVAATPQVSLSHLRSAALTRASARALRGQKGGHSPGSELSPFNVPGAERGAEGSDLIRPPSLTDGTTLESPTDSATPEKGLRKPSRNTIMQAPARPDVGGA